MLHWKNLKVWEKSNCLTKKIYELTSKFPKQEQFGVISQIRRAAYSIPVNIVEGKSRKNTKEFIQFLNISNASLEEVRYFIFLSKDLKYINEEDYLMLENKCEEISKMLNGLINSLKEKL